MSPSIKQPVRANLERERVSLGFAQTARKYAIGEGTLAKILVDDASVRENTYLALAMRMGLPVASVPQGMAISSTPLPSDITA